MEYIDIESLNNKLNEIKSFCSEYQGLLEKINESTYEVNRTNKELESYDGAKISGSDFTKGEEVHGNYIKKIEYCKRAVINPTSISTYCSSVETEINEMENKINNITKSIDSMEESAQIMAIYLLEAEHELEFVDDIYNYNLPELLKKANELKLSDAQNGYEYLHTHPTLMDMNIDFQTGNDKNVNYRGKVLKFHNEDGIEVFAPLADFNEDGTYTEYNQPLIDYFSDSWINYYNDIMKNQSRYKDFHKEAIRNNLSTIILEHSLYNRGNGAYVYESNFDKIPCKMNIDVNFAHTGFGSNHYAIEYNYAVDAYTHETGHVVDNYIGKTTMNPITAVINGGSMFSLSNKYSSFYSNINNNQNTYLPDNGSGVLRAYAFENPTENFAESVAEYYGNYNPDNNYTHYSPDDIKNVTLFEGEGLTLYDAMDVILNDGVNGIYERTDIFRK